MDHEVIDGDSHFFLKILKNIQATSNFGNVWSKVLESTIKHIFKTNEKVEEQEVNQAILIPLIEEVTTAEKITGFHTLIKSMHRCILTYQTTKMCKAKTELKCVYATAQIKS